MNLRIQNPAVLHSADGNGMQAWEAFLATWKDNTHLQQHCTTNCHPPKMARWLSHQRDRSWKTKTWANGKSPVLQETFPARTAKDSPNTSVPSIHTLNSRDDGYLGGLAVTRAFCGRAVTFLLLTKLPKPTYNAGIYKCWNSLNAGNPAGTAILTCLLQAKVHKVN